VMIEKIHNLYVPF